jgi:type III restriction enzyme
VAHDRFQEIVDEANSGDSLLRKLTFIENDFTEEEPKENVQVGANVDHLINGTKPVGSAGTPYTERKPAALLFISEAEKKAASVALEVIKQYQNKPQQAPTSLALQAETVQKEIADAVKEFLSKGQQSLLEEDDVDIAAVVQKATAIVVNNTIDMPRIIVAPKGEVSTGYRPFSLDISGIKGLKPYDRSLMSQSLQTNEQTEIGEGDAGTIEPIKERYILNKLLNFDDIPYDEHSGLLFDLSKQAVECLQQVNDEKEVENILQNQSDVIARLIHAQMDDHFYEEATEYKVDVRSGFTPLKACCYTAAQGQDVFSYRETVKNVSKIKQMLFGGFSKCLYPIQKFDSDTERRFSIILERDTIKWFKPAKGQFNM